MSEEPVENKSKPWQWPREWVKDESFWRDIATKTISASLAALLIYLSGLALGYFSSPHLVGPTIAYIGFGCIMAVQVVLFIGSFVKHKPSHEKFWRRFRYFAVASFVILIIGMIYLMASTDWSQLPRDDGDPVDPLFGF